MAPNGDAVNGVTSGRRKSSSNISRPPPTQSSNESPSIHRTLSDISFHLNKESLDDIINDNPEKQLPTISEVEDAKCECCGMREEYTVEYIERVREKFMGKWICGLCSEAVKEEMGNKQKKLEEAMNAHMSACVRFNQLGRAYPALLQAEAMRDMLRKRAPNGPKGPKAKSGIARSSSCIPAITRDLHSLSISPS